MHTRKRNGSCRMTFSQWQRGTGVSSPVTSFTLTRGTELTYVDNVQLSPPHRDRRPEGETLNVSGVESAAAEADGAAHHRRQSQDSQQDGPPVSLQMTGRFSFFPLMESERTHNYIPNNCLMDRSEPSIVVNVYSQVTFTFIHSPRSSKSSKWRTEFFSLAMGPSASSRRHTWNLSQYPWFCEHGAPPTNGRVFFWKWRESTDEDVLAHVSGLSVRRRI